LNKKGELLNREIKCLGMFDAPLLLLKEKEVEDEVNDEQRTTVQE